MFALVADDSLYLKGDETISQYFTERELEQFSYKKQGKVFKFVPPTFPMVGMFLFFQPVLPTAEGLNFLPPALLIKGLCISSR